MPQRISALLIAMTIFYNSCNFYSSHNNSVSLDTNNFKQNIDTPTIYYKGADISWVTQMESLGYNFYDSNGQKQDLYELLKSLGFNTIRLRVWVNPENGWNGINDVLIKAQRAKNAGMEILIDFHYSDFWADPGKQNKPAAWRNISFSALKDSLFNHTKMVLTRLKNNQIFPKWVQVGNEVDNGLLWPDGKATNSMSNFSQLIDMGYQAVKSVFPESQVMVHVSNGYNNSLFRWIFDSLSFYKTRFDIIGMSLYPPVNYWSKYNENCYYNMNDMVSRYNKEIHIVEIGMPYNEPDSAYKFINDLLVRIKYVKNNKGRSVMYWEPQCYNFQNYKMGAFDVFGKPTKALYAFNKK